MLSSTACRSNHMPFRLESHERVVGFYYAICACRIAFAYRYADMRTMAM
jgi:hypothetical protein